MPKLRAPVDSLRDAQRHLSVFKSRTLKAEDNNGIAAKINEVIATIDVIINKLPQEEKSFPDKAVSSALDLINKEVKKNVPKIDYLAAVRAMCNVSDVKEVYRIGREFNIQPEQIDQVIKKAPSHTPLGIAYAKLKQIKVRPLVAAIQPQYSERSAPNVIMEEEEPEITNDSDVTDNDLKQLLMQGE